MSVYAVPPTRKGVRQAEAIVEAAIACLARDGYSATSMQRIADEAGLSKRSVVYYFANRETLFEQVVERIAERLLSQVAQAIEGLEEPSDIASVGFNRVWSGLAVDRAVLTAYYGLIAEAATNPEIGAAARKLTDAFRALLSQVLDNVEASGRRLLIDRDVLTEIVIAGIQGMQLAWLERGDTPALRGAIVEFETWLGRLAPRIDA